MAEQWFYLEAGQQHGPVSDADLKALASAGRLAPGDLIWKAGMPQWLKAGNARGIFPEKHVDSLPLPPTPGLPESPSARTAYPNAREPRRASQPAKPTRKGNGLKIALILGAIFIVLLVVIGGIIFIVRATSKPNNPPPIFYSINLNENQSDVRTFQLQRNMRVTVTVHSDQQSDVDLAVVDQFGVKVAQDIRPDSDCIAHFRASRTENFRFEITNLGPGQNRCRVRIEQRSR